MKVQIREVDRNNPNEVDLLVGRCMETVLETVPEFNNDPMLARDALPNFTFEEMKAMILGATHDPHHKIIVASEINGEMMGHSIFSIKKDAEDLTYGSFFSRYIAPEHRRMGLASQLLKDGEKWMQEMGAQYGLAQTHVKNFKLQNLFRKHGYKVTGPKMAKWPYYELRKDLYLNPEPDFC